MTDLVHVEHAKGKGKAIFSNTDINKGQFVMKITGKIVHRRNVSKRDYAVQLDDDLFLEAEGKIDDYLNHSCDPTCRIDVEKMELIATRDIKKGEEITFNYNTTEYDMIRNGDAFECKCMSKNCAGKVRGFKYLNLSDKKMLKDIISPFLRKKLDEEIKTKT